MLVTGDGMPMLLDFNLAREPWADRDELEPDRLGGTLDYMAPEHLEAVSIGEDDRLDARADVFWLGVLLFEALTGSRPFPRPRAARSPRPCSGRPRSADGRPPRLRETTPRSPPPSKPSSAAASSPTRPTATPPPPSSPPTSRPSPTTPR